MLRFFDDRSISTSSHRSLSRFEMFCRHPLEWPANVTKGQKDQSSAGITGQSPLELKQRTNTGLAGSRPRVSPVRYAWSRILDPQSQQQSQWRGDVPCGCLKPSVRASGGGRVM